MEEEADKLIKDTQKVNNALNQTLFLDAELSLLKFTNSSEALLKCIAKNIIEIKYLLKEQNANRE